MAAADGMGMGRCLVTPPRPSWDLAMGLSMEKPKAVATCLLAGYREWTVKGFKGQGPRFTSIDPDMEKADQLIQDDPAGRFDELAECPTSARRSLTSPWPEHGRVTRYRVIRTAAIVAEMKHRGVEVTKMNAVHLAAILCAAVCTDPAFLVPYNDAFSYEECVGISRPALPVDNSVEPAAQPCGGMWVGDPKSWPEWKAVHQQTALAKTVADQAEVAFGEHPLSTGDDFDAEHHFLAIRAWLSDRPNALFIPPQVVVDAIMLTEGRNREEIVRCSSGRRLSSVQSVRKFVTADRPGMRGYLHAMGQMPGLISSAGDAIEWEHRQVLRISPKNEIGPDDGWAFCDLAINFRGQTDTEKVLIHGTSQSSLWSILGGMQVTASTASEEEVGVWTLKATEALDYCPLSHYGQNTWARVGICITHAGRDREPIWRQCRPAGRQERSSQTRGWGSAVSASSSSGPRRILSMWSCATQVSPPAVFQPVH